MREVTEHSRTIEEAYAVSISADDLTMKAGIRGTADILTAAALSGDSLSHCLLRIRAEFDQVAIPRRDRFASAIEHEDAVRAALRSVKTFKQARSLLLELLDEIEPEKRNAILATRILMWWLHPVCDACNGRGYEVVEGTKRLSDKACHSCHGTGRTEIPGGQKGKAVVSFLEACSEQAQRRMSRLLR